MLYSHGFGIKGKNAAKITASIIFNPASSIIKDTANKKQKLKNTISVRIILFLYNRQTINVLYVFTHKSLNVISGLVYSNLKSTKGDTTDIIIKVSLKKRWFITEHIKSINAISPYVLCNYIISEFYYISINI